MRTWWLIPALLALSGCSTPQALMAINVPLIDLRGQPHTTAQPGIHDPLQETQLLYGERVRVRKIEDGWAQIEAVEQPEFTHGRRWEGYPGWVPAATLLPSNPLAEPNMEPQQLDITKIAQKPWFVPDTTNLKEQLNAFLRRKGHFAIVVTHKDVGYVTSVGGRGASGRCPCPSHTNSRVGGQLRCLMDSNDSGEACLPGRFEVPCPCTPVSREGGG